MYDLVRKLLWKAYIIWAFNETFFFNVYARTHEKSRLKLLIPIEQAQ